MATISQVRDGLKTVIEAAVADLQVYDTVPSGVNVPAAIVIPERGSPRTLGTSKEHQEYRLQIVVGRGSERTAQDALDSFLAYSGSSSIRAALAANSDLDLAGVRCWVAGWENYGEVIWNDTSYLGADVLITVEN